ncbi:MAG TPA: acylphosphatase [Virgibacillus sp.]|nr:acylphosphatase [Virgibacillus sp.]
MNKHLIVSGHVQGVGFRFTSRNEAENLGLNGWVRNLPDGTVEMEVEGNEKTVESYIQKIKSGFHSGIRVDHIEETEQAVTDEYSGFFIR